MIDIKLFGPTVISGAGSRLVGSDLGGSKPRQLLEMLALDLGAPVAKDLLAERLWDGRPPASYIATVESYVCSLRRRLGLVGRSAWPAGHHAPRLPAGSRARAGRHDLGRGACWAGTSPT